MLDSIFLIIKLSLNYIFFCIILNVNHDDKEIENPIE